MFKTIGAINQCVTATAIGATEIITINLDSLKSLSRTGNKVAEQFEAEQDIQLAKKRDALRLQDTLIEVTPS